MQRRRSLGHAPTRASPSPQREKRRNGLPRPDAPPVKRLDAEQVTPALGKVNAILDDVKGVSGTVKDGAGRFDSVVRAAAQAFYMWFDKSRDASKRRDRVM